MDSTPHSDVIDDPAGSGIPADKQPLSQRLMGLSSTVIQVMTNPGQALAERMNQVSAPFALGISGLAFGLFFLQTGLDLMRTGQTGGGRVILLTLIGLLYGTLGVAVIGGFAWVCSRSFGSKHTVEWSVRAFALGYSPALVYALCGLPFNILLGWNTALAFGVTGLLWALGPMFVVSRELAGGKTGAGLAIATVCGGLMLIGWAWIAT